MIEVWFLYLEKNLFHLVLLISFNYGNFFTVRRKSVFSKKSNNPVQLYIIPFSKNP